MAETLSSGNRERLLRWYRNFNILGAVALAGAGVVLPQYQTVLFGLAAIDVAQAGAAEVLRKRRSPPLKTG